MAAPFFTTPRSLRADLATLGYPDINDKSVLPQGEARLTVLTWLAQQADPTFIPSTPQNLAAFWDRLGLHSAPLNNAGHRVPFTAPANRPRDKNAANCFLRAAIDLVFAFRARRAEDPLSDSWTTNPDERDQEDSPLSSFDSASLEQIDILINQRHLWFPNTTTLLQTSTAKKRPLQRRKVNTNKAKTVPRVNKVNKPERESVPSRERVLDRLRQVQRRAHDLEAELMERRGDTEKSKSPNESEDISDLDSFAIIQLADDAKALCDLAEKFDGIAIERLAERKRRTKPANRDRQMEASLSGLSKECNALQKDTQLTFDSARKAKVAAEELAHSKPLLESLPDSAAVREVLLYRDRTEQHM